MRTSFRRTSSRLCSVARDTVEWGTGVDYTYRGWTAIAQVNQLFVLNNTTELLVNDVDTTLLFILRKSFFSGRLSTEGVVLQQLERGATMGLALAIVVIRPRLAPLALALLVAAWLVNGGLRWLSDNLRKR